MIAPDTDVVNEEAVLSRARDVAVESSIAENEMSKELDGEIWETFGTFDISATFVA